MNHRFKKNNLFALSSLVLIIITQEIQLTRATQTISGIFVPTIFKRYDSPSIDQNFKRISIANTQGLVYFKYGQKSLKILDENNNHEVVYEYKQDQDLSNNFLVTDDGQYLIDIIQNRLTISRWNQEKKSMTKIYQDVQESQINYFKLNKKQDKIFLFRDQLKFQIITISTFQIQQGYLDKAQQILDMEISKDDSWVCISADAEGVFFHKITEIDSSKIELALVSLNRNVNLYQILLTSNQVYLIGQDYWQGISIFDLTSFNQQFQEGKTNIELDLPINHWWVIKDQYPYSNVLQINQEETQIYVGSRSEGIYVIDIQDILKPKVFQLIQISEDIFQIVLSRKNPYLYLCTKKSVIIYKKDQANLQMNYPNLYNKHSSILSPILITPYGWRSKMLSDNQTLIVTCSNFGVIITKFNENRITQPLEILSTISYPFLTYNDNLMVFRKEQFLMIPVQDPEGYILDIYDISNKKLPQRVQRIPSSSFTYIYSMSKNSQETLFVCQNLQQLTFFEISGNIQFTQFLVFDVPVSLSGSQTNDLVILDGFPYIILLFRAQTIAALNINDIKNPVIASKIESLGAEQIVQGSYQTNFCFIADGLEGVSVIDLRQLPQIVIISNIRIKGYTNFLNLIKNDQYIITNQLSGGQVTLIDISNINQPEFVSKLQFKSEFSAAASLTSDFRFLFVINSGGVRTIPIKSNIFIHYEFQEIKRYSTGQIELVKLEQTDQTLKVGQIILVSLNPLYPIAGSQITNAYFVENGRLKTIPSWMSFDSYERTLVVNINKDSLNVVSSANNDMSNEITKQTVVFVTKLVISEDSFVYQSENNGQDIITIDMSKKIFASYKEKGILNHINQISDYYAEDEEFSVSSVDGINLSDEGLLKIKRVLQQSLYYSPIELQIQKSLIINLQSDSQFITSYSKQASLLLKINKSDGKFVSRLYAGVITSTSDRQDQIKLEGEIVSLNEILKQKIEIFLINKNNLNAQIQIQVSDGINNDYIATFQYSEITSILSLKQDIVIEDFNKLQKQVNRQYPDSSIDIDSQVQIEFQFDTYSYAVFNHLTLQAYVLDELSSEPITNQMAEIQFTPQQFKFYIKTSRSDFNRKYCFSVNATDSYSWVIDSFCVTASSISFIIFLNIFISIVGPLLFFLGIFKYWNRLFNITYYRRNIYGYKEIPDNAQFVQKFIVVNDSYLIGQKLYNEFKRTLIKNEKLKKSISREYSPSLSPEMKRSNISRFNIKLEQVGSTFENGQGNNDPKLSKYQNQKINQLIGKTIKQLNQKLLNNIPNYQEFEKYVTNQQKIDVKQFVIDLFNANVPISYQSKVIYPHEFQSELNDTGSVLYNCISGLLIKDLLKLNKRSNIIYQYLKESCKIYNQYPKNQWTNVIIEPLYVLKQKKYNEEQIIPNFNVDKFFLQKMLFLIIKNINKNQNNSFTQAALQQIQDQLGIDLQLIINGIIVDALGITSPTNNSLFPNSGESIHLLEHQIKKIQAYVKIKNSNSFCLSKLCNMEYVPLFSRKNQQLPNWLKIKIERQLITLYGIPPLSSHYSQIKINVFNNKECIVREIILKLSSKKINSELNLTKDNTNFDSQIVSEHECKLLEEIKMRSILKSPKEFELLASENEYTNHEFNQENNILNQKNKKNQKFQIQIQESQSQSDSASIQQSNIYQLSRKIFRSSNPLSPNNNF